MLSNQKRLTTRLNDIVISICCLTYIRGFGTGGPESSPIKLAQSTCKESKKTQVQSSSYQLGTNCNFVYTDLNAHFKTSFLFFKIILLTLKVTKLARTFCLRSIFKSFSRLIDWFICCFTSYSETLHPDLADPDHQSLYIYIFSSVFVHDKYKAFLNI